MKTQSYLFALTFLAVALAGCASDTPVTDPTPATTTPAVTPTPTSELAPPEGEGEGEHEMPAPLDCPEPESTTTPPGNVMGYPELVFTVKENDETTGCYSWVGPATATAGWTAITLQNNGMEPHIMPMYKLTQNKTLADAKAVIQSEAEEEPEWMIPAGGVGFATPFASGTAIMDLEPGNYLIVCWFGGHHMAGMFRMLTVTAAEDNATALPEPTANVTIEMSDFAFNVSNVTPGRHIVKFVNTGEQPHESPLIALNDNATMQDFVAAVEGGQGPPPGAGVGGVNVIFAGGHAYGVVDFEAGKTYGLICFVGDEETHQPHFLLGMIDEFTVPGTADAPPA